MARRVRSKRSSLSSPRIWGTHVLFFLHLVAFLTLVVGESASWYTPALESLALGDGAALWERPWTLLTHLFVHRHPLEFMLGAGVLLLAGFAIEERLGTRRYLAFYGAATVLVGLAHVGLYELGLVGGRLFSGSVGAGAGLLTAYLFLLGGERRVGSIPFPAFYLMAAAALFALLATIGLDMDRDLGDRMAGLREEAYRAEKLTTIERVERLAQLPVERALRPDMLTHTLGLGLGGLVLLLGVGASHVQRHHRLQLEIRGLQEEVHVRARVEELLAKISRDGVGALTRPERRFLRYASRFYEAPRDLSARGERG